MVTRRSGGGGTGGTSRQALAARARWSRRASQMAAAEAAESESAQPEPTAQEPEEAAEEDETLAPADDDDDEDAAPSDAADEEERPDGAPSPEPNPVMMPRRRGRPPKRPGWDDPGKDDVSDANTPRRGRKPRGGGRGRGRGRGLPVTPRVLIDKDGTEAEVVDDEALLAEDPEGEKKVDKQGNLLEGREYRVRTFTILGRGEKLYMLSTEPARCTGYRDSYLFFAKHPTLYKVLIGDDEKRDLIDRHLLPHSYKGRSIGVVTARSVFREFGARIIVGGKRVLDDYKEQEARDRGDAVGELADPFDRLPEPGTEYNRNQYVAWHGASAVYHSDKPNVPAPNGVPVKRKVPVTATNWMLQHAMEAARFNANLTAARKTNRDGAFDAHTNLLLYPRHMQPTHARWERVADAEHVALAAPASSHANGTRSANGTNGTNGDHAPASVTYMDAGARPPAKPHAGPSFAPISSAVARNYLVVDSYFQSPPSATWPAPGPSPFTEQELRDFDLPTAGLPALDAAALAELPDDCRDAFAAARAEEQRWRDAFPAESEGGGREKLRIGVGAF